MKWCLEASQIPFTLQFYLKVCNLSLGPQMNSCLIHNQEKGHLPPNIYSSNGIQIQNVLEKIA
jgi:hypothetical protein